MAKAKKTGTVAQTTVTVATGYEDFVVHANRGTAQKSQHTN